MILAGQRACSISGGLLLSMKMENLLKGEQKTDIVKGL
jgi:hypothetical protein